MKLMNPRSGNVRSRMSFAYPLTFLRRAMAIPALMSIMLALSVSLTWGASSPTKITIHIPGKSLTVMVFYFGKDKGFFFEEGIDAQLVAMSPPVAIAAMVAGELDFSTTLGAATAAIMRGSSLKRVFYVQQDPTFALTAQPEIKTIRELIGKVIGVNAPTDAMGMSAKMILKGNGIDPSQEPSFLPRSPKTLTRHCLAKESRRPCYLRPMLRRQKQEPIAAWLRPRTTHLLVPPGLWLRRKLS
jgi:ABC-type nitrate/sulfonate/bicarbonate transport system substrate-binding protein